MLALVLTTLTAAVVAVLAAHFEVTHLHLLLVLPVGATAMGAVIGAAVAASIRLTHSYDTPGLRMLGTVAGLAAYWAAVVLEFTGLSITLGPFKFRGPLVLTFPAYLTRMVRAQGQPVTNFLDPWLDIPARFDSWFGLAVIAIEMIVLLFAVGWVISYLGDVPYCRRDRRFYRLRDIIETRDEELLKQWMQAVHERRPMEARSDFGRIRSGQIWSSMLKTSG